LPAQPDSLLLLMRHLILKSASHVWSVDMWCGMPSPCLFKKF